MTVFLKIGLNLSLKKHSIFRQGTLNLIENTIYWLLIDKKSVFSQNYGDFLHILLKLNHLILDEFMDVILKRLQPVVLVRILKDYVDHHVNVRQFSKLTHKLIKNIANDCDLTITDLTLPCEFYDQLVSK
jgi:hypothetical protein